LQWGTFSLEAAVGVHFKERYDAAQCLARLLSLQLLHQLAGPQIDAASARKQFPLLAVVMEFNNQLLKDKDNRLIKRIISVIKVGKCFRCSEVLSVQLSSGCRPWGTHF
jgi:hypothetical protein